MNAEQLFCVRLRTNFAVDLGLTFQVAAERSAQRVEIEPEILEAARENNGEVLRWRPTAGQPFMAVPRHFGFRKNGRSSPPSAMKNVDRSFPSPKFSRALG